MSHRVVSTQSSEPTVSEKLGDDPIVRFVGHSTVEPMGVWFGSYAPFNRVFPYTGMTLDRHTIDSVTNSEEQPLFEDIAVVGDTEFLFMDVVGLLTHRVGDFTNLTVVFEDYTEMDNWSEYDDG